MTHNMDNDLSYLNLHNIERSTGDIEYHPLPLDKKVEAYRRMFEYAGILLEQTL